jgi:hypothetical protein
VSKDEGGNTIIMAVQDIQLSARFDAPDNDSVIVAS